MRAGRGLLAGAAPVLGLCAIAATAASSRADAAAAIDPATHSGAVRILRLEPLRTRVATDSAGVQRKSTTVHEMRFDAFGRSFNLALEDNRRLAALLSQPKASAGPALRLYQGRIPGVPRSWARFAARGAELHGLLWDGADLYVIEPAERVKSQVAPGLDAPAAGTVIFRLSDTIMNEGAPFCAADAAAPIRAGSEAYATLLGELKTYRAAMQAAGATVRIEMSALGDSSFLARYPDQQTARDEILLRLNNVDGIFSGQLGVEIQVPSLSVMDPASDPLSTTATPSSLLSELGQLRKRSAELRSRGLTHLFTGRDLEGTTVGIAYLDSLCQPEYGVALTEVNNRGSWIESLIAAHEIGHNFGAVHDGDPNDACAATPQDVYLMSPSVSQNSSTFSQCSVDLMQPRIQSATCITALPPPDLSIPADLGTLHRAVSRPFDWQLNVTNAGGSTALDARADILVTPVVIVDEAYVTGGSCTSAAGVIQCQLGDIPVGASRAVNLTLHSDVVGSDSISARVSAANELATLNNAGDGTLVIDPEADLSIALLAPDSATTGESFAATFTATNLAAIDATNVVVTLDLPGGLAAGSAALGGEPCIVQATSVRCSVASLGAGTAVDGTVSLTAQSAGSATVRARVSGSYVDPVAANDQAERTISVAAASPTVQATPASAGSGGGGGSSGAILLLGLVALLRARRATGASTT